MEPNHRFPTLVLVFMVVYVAAIGLLAMRSGKTELGSYLLLMATLILAISIVKRQSHPGRPLLWCLSAWRLMHMAEVCEGA